MRCLVLEVTDVYVVVVDNDRDFMMFPRGLYPHVDIGQVVLVDTQKRVA